MKLLLVYIYSGLRVCITAFILITWTSSRLDTRRNAALRTNFLFLTVACEGV